MNKMTYSAPNTVLVFKENVRKQFASKKLFFCVYMLIKIIWIVEYT
jgi:hypothetical protein